MSSPRLARWTAGLAAAAVCAVPAAVVPATASAGDDGRTPAPATSDHARSLATPSSGPSGHRDDPLTSDQYVGVDGKVHKRSPVLVRGKNGTVYYGEELDGACGYGRQFGQALLRLAQLARVIRKSGRQVMFTVAPNKSAVNKQDLRLNKLPHGNCDVMGIAQQDRTLDTFRDPAYLPMRKQLAKEAADGQKDLFWPIDTHWTKLSSVQWIQAVADRLNPKLAKRQTYRKGKETIQTDVSYLGIIPPTKERGPALFPTTPVTVTTAPGSVDYDPSKQISSEHEWYVKPARMTYPGRTLLIGDSFTYRGMDSLMPLFEHGQFLWIGQPDVPDVASAIPLADTVIIEVVQRWLPISQLTKKSFKNDVRNALAASDG